jgi:hypothetical protein
MANQAASSISTRLNTNQMGTAPRKTSYKVNSAIILANPTVVRALFYVGCFFIALVVWWIERRVEAAPQVYGEFVTDFGASRKSQLSAFLEMNRLIITLSTATLGAMGFFLAHSRTKFLARELWAASACVVCVGLSLFYGYHAYQDIVFMFQNNTFDLGTPLIAFDGRWHFAMFILGSFFFVDFAWNELSKKEEPPSNGLSDV